MVVEGRFDRDILEFAFEQQLKKSIRTFKIFRAGCRDCVRNATESISKTIPTFGLVDSDSDLVRQIDEYRISSHNSLLARTELRDLEASLLSLDRHRTVLQRLERDGLIKPKKFVHFNEFYHHIIQELARIGTYRVTNDVRHDSNEGHIKFDGMKFEAFVDRNAIRINKDELRKELKRLNSNIRWISDGWREFEEDNQKWLKLARDHSEWQSFVRGHDFEDFVVHCLWDQGDDHSKRKIRDLVYKYLLDLRPLVWESAVGEQIKVFLEMADQSPV